MIDKVEKKAILTALEESQFKWRTARGLAKDTDLALQDVQEFLENSQAILRSKKSNKSGSALYTTRKRYKSRTMLSTRLLAAMKNEAL